MKGNEPLCEDDLVGPIAWSTLGWLLGSLLLLIVLLTFAAVGVLHVLEGCR